MINRLRLSLRSVLLRRRLEREMQAEMAEHIERSTERLVARGLSPVSARREAIREFGNVTYLQEEGRNARGTTGLDTLVGDLCFAVRHFARSPLSTLTIVTVLAVGIGIDVVLFTFVDSFTDRPPSGVEASADLVRIRGSQLGIGGRAERAFTMEEFEAYAGLETHFSAVAAWTSQPVTLAAGGTGEATVTATFVSEDYFRVLGVEPVFGSGLITGADDRAAVLSHMTWTRSFAADPAALGRTITLNGVPFTIVGVAPPLFRGAYWEARDDMQLWLPMGSRAAVFPETAGGAELFRVIARLQPGIGLEIAGAAVNVVAARTVADLGEAPGQDGSQVERDPSAEVVPLLADNLEPDFETNARVVRLAFGLLGLLTLLVTCANVSSLQTGLALARRREVAIRMSLGARRGRVVRQLVTESLLLATLAGVAAIGVTFAIIQIILAIVGSLSFELVFDRTTLLFTFGVALAAGLLFGLSPALHATRVSIVGALKDSAASIAGAWAGLQRGLVVAQIAFTQPLAVCVTTLVILATLEYRENPRTPLGEQIVRLRLATTGARDLSLTNDSEAAVRERANIERLASVLRDLPGVGNAVYDPNRLVIDRNAITLPAARRVSDRSEQFFLTGQSVMPGYLDVMGLPLLLGRDFEPADTGGFRADAVPAIVGDDMVRSLWGGGNPIGQRVQSATAAGEPMVLEVVGVYERALDAAGHSRDNFTVFLPPDPRPTGRAPNGFVLLRTTLPPETVVATIRQTVGDEAPGSPITELRTLAAVEDEQRFILWGGIALFSAGGIIVLLLSALGLYAVVAFTVGRRTGEIAVRMAIGARRRQIVRHFASDGLRLTAFGIALGLPLSVLGLYGMLALASGEPDVNLALVTAVVALAVLAVSGVASWIPASRAARVDPAVVLRRE